LDGQTGLKRLFELQRRYNGLYASYLSGQVNRTLDPADKENTFRQEWEYDHYFSAGADALRLIVAALTAGGNGDVTAVELPGLNHLFQKCKTCSPSEYGTLEETFSTTALEIMGDWLARHTRPQ